MIIMNQKRDVLLNFGMLQTIYAHDGLVRTDVQGAKLTLGEYVDQRRAREILDEIVDVYASYMNRPGGPMATVDFYVQPQTFIPHKVYRMPEE